MGRAVRWVGAAASVTIVAGVTVSGVRAATPNPAIPTFTAPARADDPNIDVDRSEPATAVSADGTRYVAYQTGSQLEKSIDGGRTWLNVGGQDIVANHVGGSCSSHSDSGDVELATDQVGRVFMATLNVTSGGTDDGLQVGVVRSDDGFTTMQGTCASHQPFSVDREWMAAWTAPGDTSDHGHVYLSYHDFGPDAMWVNSSSDGGQTWGSPVDVVTAADAADASACDTIPAGIATDPRNGWVYVAWLAGSDAAANAATGCNYTQGTVFNNFYVAVSKDSGQTWTATKAFGGPGPTAAAPNDMSEIFGSIVVDRAGGVGIAFPAFLDGEYRAYFAYAPPAPNGSLAFGAPIVVNGPDIHTSYFVRAVAGDAGRFAVMYLGSPVKNVEATATNKVMYDGSDPKQPNCQPEASGAGAYGVRFPGKPCMMPADAPWYGELTVIRQAGSPSPSLTTVRLRPDAVHTGDICTLGIFCLPSDDRDLADTNDLRIDATGGVQLAYTYESADKKVKQIHFQCQQSGPGLLASVGVKPCQALAASVAAPTPVNTPAPSTKGAGARMPATGSSHPYALPGLALLAVGLFGARWSQQRRRPSSTAPVRSGG